MKIFLRVWLICTWRDQSAATCLNQCDLQNHEEIISDTPFPWTLDRKITGLLDKIHVSWNTVIKERRPHEKENTLSFVNDPVVEPSFTSKGPIRSGFKGLRLRLHFAHVIVSSSPSTLPPHFRNNVTCSTKMSGMAPGTCFWVASPQLYAYEFEGEVDNTSTSSSTSPKPREAIDFGSSSQLWNDTKTLLRRFSLASAHSGTRYASISSQGGRQLNHTRTDTRFYGKCYWCHD